MKKVNADWLQSRQSGCSFNTDIEMMIEQKKRLLLAPFKNNKICNLSLPFSTQFKLSYRDGLPQVKFNYWTCLQTNLRRKDLHH